MSRVGRDIDRRAPVPEGGLARVGDDRGDRRGVRGGRRGARARAGVRRRRRCGAGQPRLGDHRHGVRRRHGDRHGELRTRSRSSSSASACSCGRWSPPPARSSCSRRCRTSRRRRGRPSGSGPSAGSPWVTGYTLLQENVTDEFRDRTFGSLTVLSRLALFLSLTVFPSLAGVIERLCGSSVGLVRTLRPSGRGSRSRRRGRCVIAGRRRTRSLLQRYRLTRPEPLTLVPKLKRPPATGLFIAFEGSKARARAPRSRAAEAYLRERGLRRAGDARARRHRAGEKIRDVLLDPETGRLDAARRGVAVRGQPGADRAPR